MDPLVPLLLFIALYLSTASLGLYFDGHDRVRRQRNRELASVVSAFKTAARQLGWRMESSRRRGDVHVAGLAGDTRVTVHCTAVGPGQWLTTIAARPRVRPATDFSLQSRWRARAPHPVGFDAQAPLFDTGDGTFDALISVHGRAATAHACLSPAARGALVTLARTGEVRVHDGELVYRTPERIWQASQLTTFVRQTLAACSTLAPAGEEFAALARACRTDPLPSVRERCLATLVSDQMSHPEMPALLDAALGDPSDAVRVVVARALGESGLPVLREVAARADSEEQPAARAIAVLGRRLPLEETLTILDSAITQRRPLVVAAAIESLGHAKDPRACGRLQALLLGGDEHLAVAAAHALGTTPSEAAEQALVSALPTSGPAVRHAIVGSLGRVGGLHTMTLLSTLAEAGDADSGLIAVARQAIAAIQARLPGAAAGQVSLSEGASGALSLAEPSEAGRVSVADE